jgi:hypothetical protein
MEDKLLEIWSKPYISELPNQIKSRGFTFAQNKNEKEILITGINPSFRIGENEGNYSFDFEIIAKETKYDSYWTSLKKMLSNENINLLNRTAYLDIFHFREKEQRFLKKEILTIPLGLIFISDQLNLTQNIIENVIKPKLIIVKNKESSAYWGKLADKGIIWMGYKMEFEQETPFGELYKIKGLIDSPQRVSPEIITTNLVNTSILFTAHINQYTPKIKRPTPEFISSLLK